jgi:hypothetical protein
MNGITSVEGLQILLEAQRRLFAEMNTLWNFFSVIALGVVGIIYGGVEVGSVGRARVLISVGFAVWAAGNLSQLVKAQGLLATLTTSIQSVGSLNETPDVLKSYLQQVYITPVWRIILFHLVLDALVLGAIWWPTLAGAPPSQK